MMEKIRSYRFGKEEKLCNIRDIAMLFKGEGLFSFPFKVAYRVTISDHEQPQESQLSVKVLCSVGKKYSKSAVKRNLIKRRIREAYRLNKHLLLEPLEECVVGKRVVIHIGFIYISKKEESYEVQQKSMQKILDKLCGAVKKSCNSSATAAN